MLGDYVSESGMVLAKEFIERMNGGGSGIEKLIHPEGLVQHNPTIGDGVYGLAVALDGCHGNHPRFRVLLEFEAAPYIVMVCTREISALHLGIEIFEIKDGKICAHWDNYCHTSARFLEALGVGVAEVSDFSQEIIEPLSMRQAERIVLGFVNDVLCGCDLASGWHISPAGYKEWRSEVGIFVDRPREHIVREYGFSLPFRYLRVHKIITNGKFALVVIEGSASGHATCHFEFMALDRLGIYFRVPVDELVILPGFRRHSNSKFSFPG